MYIEQREQFLWKQVHLNRSTKYRLLNKMEMLQRFLPDPLGRKLSVKTRGSYLLHKIQLSPVAPYSWMTCHQKLPFSSGMQENCPFPFICTRRAHGACGNLLWSLLLFFFLFFFFLTPKQYLNYIPELNQTQRCNCQNYSAISLRVTKVHLLLREKECMLPLSSPPNSVSCWENPCLWGHKLFPLNFFSSKFAFFLGVVVVLL